jgi:hypothetical protein
MFTAARYRIGMRQAAVVAIGQRFQSIGTLSRAPIYIYEVQDVFRSRVDQLEYARLALIDDRTYQKSVATAALLNRRLFIPLSTDGPLSQAP